MNIIEQTYKRKLNKVGEYAEMDGRKLCYLDKNKLLKKKILKKSKNDENFDVMDIDCETLIKNIIYDKDITYIFEFIHFKDNIKINLSDLNLKYNECGFEDNTTLAANNIKCEDCTFKGNMEIYADRISMKRNDYEIVSDSQKKINIYGSHTHLEDEAIPEKYDLEISGINIKKIEIENCNIHSPNIYAFNMDAGWTVNDVIDIIGSKIRCNIFKTNLQILNLKNTNVEVSSSVTFGKTFENFKKTSLVKSSILIGSEKIKIKCNEFESTDSFIIAPKIDINSEYSDLTNSNLISENMFIKSDNLTIISNKDNSIHADKGIYLEIKEDADFNSKDIHSPLIIFNENIVSKNKENESADISLIEPRNKLVDSLRRIRDYINNNINEMNKSIEEDLIIC